MNSLRWCAAVTVMAMSFGSAAAGAQAGAVPAKDAAEIHAALDGMQAAWNHHDMTAFVSYMTDDVEWVNVVGMWWKGKAQVFKAHDRMHKTTFKDRQLHDAQVVELRMIAPEVVIATSIIPADSYTSADGHVTPANRNVLTETFVHRDGKWLVAEGHNTVIVEEAQAHDPGK
jgi:uncharacterized protein (TIGR02246 family)